MARQFRRRGFLSFVSYARNCSRFHAHSLGDLRRWRTDVEVPDRSSHRSKSLPETIARNAFAAVKVMCAPVCIIALFACEPKARLHDDTIVRSRDQAASITISVSSVIPWNRISQALQPNFSLTSADALKAVAPLIASLGSQSGSGTTLGASFAVQAPSTAAAGSSAPTAPSVNSQLPSLPGVTAETGVDPVLKYQTARALYEAVQLMNREVQETALRHCFVPYLVQLKLAVLPYRRHLPYDIHARLSFFRQPHSTSPARSAAAAKSIAANHSQCSENAWDLPQVIPLLVTDDIERATASRAAQAAVQAALGLQYSGPGVAGGTAINRLAQTLQSVSAQDINTRFTVSRQTYNTLYVRIGAAIEGTSDYALVGQTYDIPVLLLVPTSAFDLSRAADPRVQVVAYTEFRDARTGEVLPDRPGLAAWTTVDREITTLLERTRNADSLHGWEQATPEEKEDVAVALFNAVQSSNSADFVDVLCKHHIFRGKNFSCTTEGGSGWDNIESFAKSLWPQISTLRSDSPFQSAFIQMRWPEPIKIGEQDATGFEDKDDLTVWLGGVVGNDTSGMTARLVVPGPRGNTFSLLSTGIVFDALAHTLSLKFPSPSKWGISTGSATLKLDWESCSSEEVCPDQPGGATDVKVAILSARPAPPGQGPVPSP